MPTRPARSRPRRRARRKPPAVSPLQALFLKLWQDQDLLARFLASPREVLAEEGLEVSANVRVQAEGESSRPETLCGECQLSVPEVSLRLGTCCCAAPHLWKVATGYDPEA